MSSGTPLYHPVRLGWPHLLSLALGLAQCLPAKSAWAVFPSLLPG